MKSNIIGLCAHYKRCRYCGKEFTYVSGGGVADPIKSYREACKLRDEHELICDKNCNPKNTEWNDIHDDDMDRFREFLKDLKNNRIIK